MGNIVGNQWDGFVPTPEFIQTLIRYQKKKLQEEADARWLQKLAQKDVQEVSMETVVEQVKHDNAWDADFCTPTLRIFDRDLTVQVVDLQWGMAGTVLAKFPLQIGQKLGYFEVKMDEESYLTLIGFATRDFPLDEAIGLFKRSYSLDSAGFLHVCGEKKQFGPPFGRDNETVGCGIKPNGEMFITLNGKLFEGQAPLPTFIPDVELFPAVTLVDYGTKVEANFGDDPAKPFLFDLNSLKMM